MNLHCSHPETMVSTLIGLNLMLSSNRRLTRLVLVSKRLFQQRNTVLMCLRVKSDAELRVT